MNSLATPEPAHICHLDVGPEFAVVQAWDADARSVIRIGSQQIRNRE